MIDLLTGSEGRTETEPGVAAGAGGAPRAELGRGAGDARAGAGGAQGAEDRLGLQGRVLFALATLAWIGLLLIGTTVDSGPYRDALLGSASGEGLSGTTKLGYLLLVLASYTITNLPLLGCTASVLGALARQAEIGVEGANGAPIDRTNPYVSAAVRGIFVYLFVISGMLVVVEAPFSSITLEQYIRLAGFTSLLCFLLSHNPEMASRILMRASEAIEGKTGGKG